MRDTFIIFDVEFTSWEGSLQRNWSEEWEHMEIVKLSALKVKDCGDRLEIVDAIDLLVVPRINPALSDYFTALTSITNEQVQEEGMDFTEAMELFFDFVEDLRIFSYGGDEQTLVENDELYATEMERLKGASLGRFRNLKPFFRTHGVDTSRYSSGELHRAFGIPLEGHVHDSSFDVLSLFASLQHFKTLFGHEFLARMDFVDDTDRT